MEIIDLKQELRLIKALNKLFEAKIGNHDLKAIPGDIGFLDAANVCMVVCKSDRFKAVFERFTDREFEIKPIPPLIYLPEASQSGLLLQSKYSIVYLLRILDCFAAVDENPVLSLKNDYPLWVSGDHFSFILAPKVDY